MHIRLRSLKTSTSKVMSSSSWAALDVIRLSIGFLDRCVRVLLCAFVTIDMLLVMEGLVSSSYLLIVFAAAAPAWQCNDLGEKSEF